MAAHTILHQTLGKDLDCVRTAREFSCSMQLKEQGHVSWECQSELFRQEVEGADDIRLDAPLISKCMGDKRTFCKDVAPGTQPH